MKEWIVAIRSLNYQPENKKMEQLIDPNRIA